MNLKDILENIDGPLFKCWFKENDRQAIKEYALECKKQNGRKLSGYHLNFPVYSSVISTGKLDYVCVEAEKLTISQLNELCEMKKKILGPNVRGDGWDIMDKISINQKRYKEMLKDF